MKNKLKYNPFLATVGLFVFLFLILIASAIGTYYYVFAIPEPEGLSLASWPKNFTRNFSLWIEAHDDDVRVKQTGIERLDEYGLWVQIVDENGQEIFAHNKPANYPTSYGLSGFSALAEGAYENGHTTFTNSVTLVGSTFNYVVGFPYAIGKYDLYYNGENVARLSPITKVVALFAACTVILCVVGYAFWLSRKLLTITRGVRSITSHDYQPLKETGVFGELYGSLNQMNNEIRHSEALQEETNRTQKEWIANITHDLKTPLSPIKGYGELLTEGESIDPELAQEYGKIILKNADHMELLMNDLKLTYQLEAGAIPYAPQEIRIVRFLKELVITITNDPAFSKRHLTFESELLEQTIVIDPELLRRAISNIVINALVHNSSDTQVKVHISEVCKDKIAISVSDNGEGMTEKALANLWSRYYRGTNTKEKTEGSGLGLAIAKQIITLHGGEISASSHPGSGTTFVILLPKKAETN